MGYYKQKQIQSQESDPPQGGEDGWPWVEDIPDQFINKETNEIDWNGFFFWVNQQENV